MENNNVRIDGMGLEHEQALALLDAQYEELRQIYSEIRKKGDKGKGKDFVTLLYTHNAVEVKAVTAGNPGTGIKLLATVLVDLINNQISDKYTVEVVLDCICKLLSCAMDNEKTMQNCDKECIAKMGAALMVRFAKKLEGVD